MRAKERKSAHKFISSRVKRFLRFMHVPHTIHSQNVSFFVVAAAAIAAAVVVFVFLSSSLAL